MISIIIAVYNVEDYIGKCIKSILCQTYSNFEIIIVNDGSTDKSLEICTKYAENESRIHIVNQENKGVSSARNKGLKMAKGDYICFIDGDDYIDVDYLKIMYNNIVITDSDIAICKWSRNQISTIETDKKIFTWNRNQAFYELFKSRTFDGAVCCKLYKKQLISDITFSKNIRLGEDQIFVIQAIEKSEKIVFQDIPLYIYRYRETSAMNTVIDERYWDAVYRAEWIVREADKFPELRPLFKQEEISIYIYLVIVSYQNSTEVATAIAKFVYPRIKDSNLFEYKKYANVKDFIQYFIIKYFPLCARLGIKLKKMI